jgi:hypothetical protein
VFLLNFLIKLRRWIISMKFVILTYSCSSTALETSRFAKSLRNNNVDTDYAYAVCQGRLITHMWAASVLLAKWVICKPSSTLPANNTPFILAALPSLWVSGFLIDTTMWKSSAMHNLSSVYRVLNLQGWCMVYLVFTMCVSWIPWQALSELI